MRSATSTRETSIGSFSRAASAQQNASSASLSAPRSV
jgi:hypothetical protein